MSRWNKDKKDSEQTMQLLKNEILEYFRYAISTDDKETLLSIGRITPEGRDLLSMLRKEAFKNKDIEVVLNASNLRHIYINHYGQNEKDKGNNIPLTDDDICSIGDMMANTTDIVYGIDKKDKLGKYFFLSRSKDGTYNLSELYSDKWGRLNIRSLYNTKKGPSQRVMAIVSTLLPTSATYSGLSLSSVAKIPNLFELHKDFDEKIPIERNFRLKALSDEYHVPYDLFQNYMTSCLERRGTDEAFKAIEETYRSQYRRLDKGVVDGIMIQLRTDLDRLAEQNMAARRLTTVNDQIKCFEEITGIRLQIKDGRPYYKGNLDLFKIKTLSKIPEGLVVHGVLDISGCPITTLPKNLEVSRGIFADGCPIRNILEGVHASLLQNRNNPNKNIYIGPSATFEESIDFGKSSIQELPSSIKTRHLYIQGTPIKKLPEDLYVNYLSVQGCCIDNISTLEEKGILILRRDLTQANMNEIIKKRLIAPDRFFPKEDQDFIIDYFNVTFDKNSEDFKEYVDYTWKHAIESNKEARDATELCKDDVKEEFYDLIKGVRRSENKDLGY